MRPLKAPGAHSSHSTQPERLETFAVIPRPMSLKKLSKKQVIVFDSRARRKRGK
jgi:hypothetical protein